MSQIKISTTGWLAISLRNSGTGVFNLHDTESWQYLQTKSSIDQSGNENTNDLHRNLSKFSPNGRRFVCNGQDKQLNVYIQSGFEETNLWWELQRMITVKNSISSIDLTNDSLYIADINGDVYKIDLSSNDQYQDLIISPENCILKNKSMLLDIVVMQMNEKKSVLITADQDAQIRLSNTDGYCLGHTEFVSHLKLIDNNTILSASGDGKIFI
jgi:hypothetical protein